MLADLRMPGALEALDALLHGVDGATLTAPEAIEQLLGGQIQLRNNRRLQAAMRSSRLPPSSGSPSLAMRPRFRCPFLKALNRFRLTPPNAQRT